MLSMALFELEVFSELRRQAQVLRALQQKRVAAISPYKKLPEEYLCVIFKVPPFLDTDSTRATAQLIRPVSHSHRDKVVLLCFDICHTSSEYPFTRRDLPQNFTERRLGKTSFMI